MHGLISMNIKLSMKYKIEISFKPNKNLFEQ